MVLSSDADKNRAAVYGYGSGKGIKAEDRTGKKGYGMGLAYRKIPGYHIIFNRSRL